MDSLAFKRVYNFYLNEFEKTIRGKSPVIDFFRSSQLGMAFRSMIDLNRFRSFRENIFKNLRDQVQTITLLEDSVIPSKGVVDTLSAIMRKENVRVWDFPYTYTHENPFPVFASPFSEQVDDSFEKVFSEAAGYLA
jgi:hypothetical protein